MNINNVDFSKINYSKYQDDIEEINEICRELKKDKRIMKKMKLMIFKLHLYDVTNIRSILFFKSGKRKRN